MKKKGSNDGPSFKASKNAKQKHKRKKKNEQFKPLKQADDLPEMAKEGGKEESLPKVQWAKKPPKKKQEDVYESHSEEDYSDTQQERKNEYRKGGYHPVHEGELYNSRYRVVKKLGWGYFSTVWLCWDHEESNFKAIKIQKSAQHYREAAQDEITLLSQIRDGDPDNSKSCCRLTDHFEHKGPNGQHVVMVFEVLGENLLELIMKYDYKGIPIPVVKNITRQVLVALDYLHRELHIIHTDLKPENVVVAMPQKGVQQAMETYTPPGDRFKQLSLIDRDPATLSKSQRKRLRKKLKMKQKNVHDGSCDDKDGDDDQEDQDDENECDDAEKGQEQGKVNGQDKAEVVKENGVVKLQDAAEEVSKASEVKAPAEEVNEAQKPEGANEAKKPVEEAHSHTANATKDGEVADGVTETKSAQEPDSPAVEQKKKETPKVPEKGDATNNEPPKVLTAEESAEEALKRYSRVKLVDFGNACWTHRHFTEDIQTRQYRAPEVIVRNSYNTSADIWSCACLVFELLTGDFLFDPQESEYIDRDEDHLALIVELLQTQPQVPPCLYAKGANEYINSQGYLRHINHLKFWDLKSVLHEKYKFRADKAAEIANFLLPMLSIDPSRRATAQHMLRHPWLKVIPTDWEPYVVDQPPPPEPEVPSSAQFQSDEDWEEDEESEEGGEFGEIELPAGMTPEMYRLYVQQQMELLKVAELRAREGVLSPEDVPPLPQELEARSSVSSGSPGSPPSESPQSDLVALSLESDVDALAGEEEAESPVEPQQEGEVEETPDTPEPQS